MKKMIDLQGRGIKLAQWVTIKTTRPELRRFAANLETRETAEMQFLQEWLLQWHKVRHSPRPDGAFGGELAAMAALKAEEFEIEAIQALVEYVQAEFLLIHPAQQRAEHGLLKDLAAVIVETNQTDIDQLKPWIDAAWRDDRATTGPLPNAVAPTSAPLTLHAPPTLTPGK